MSAVRYRLDVAGVVQGVGFRPFVYNLARARDLSGLVFNSRRGAVVEIEGDEGDCRHFIDTLKNNPPPLARIEEVVETSIPPAGEAGFKIIQSSPEGDDITPIAPDMDVCPDCLRELFDPADRRYRYPFINCTNCGPRYTIVEKTPYDRPYTSMKAFPMCPQCQKEYDDPADRRFHAQPNACPVCGPRPTLYDAGWNAVACADPVAKAAELLREGRVVAVKGLGGYHFACDATDRSAVETLRNRKMRKEKPFAVMSASAEAVMKYAHLDEEAERLLVSRERPIVLLRKRGGGALCEGIAPGLREYGVFLPYTPLQYLLFASGAPETLVMTSGNISDEPIVFTEDELSGRLKGIADYTLSHDRRIVWRCDDSIVRAGAGGPMLLRRSRGFVPLAIFPEKGLSPMLACGGDLKNMFCLADKKFVIHGPHIGDLMNVEANRSFRDSIAHFKKVFRIEPQTAVVDMHPGYFSAAYGRSLGVPVVEVQHHHAHIASVMAENRLAGEVIGVALDGTGYGADGGIWGGEFLVCSYLRSERLGCFPELRLPGGDMAAKEPWRTATALLYQVFGDAFANLLPAFVEGVGEERVEKVVAMVDAELNCPASTGAGRWFDAAASLLLVRHENSFEGQAPMMLEALCDPSCDDEFSFGIGGDGVLRFEHMVRELACMAETESGRIRGATMFHNTLAAAVAQECMILRDTRGLGRVCLGGGVFQNNFLLGRVLRALRGEKFEVFLPRDLPVNDGGLAYGQLAIAAARL